MTMKILNTLPFICIALFSNYTFAESLLGNANKLSGVRHVKKINAQVLGEATDPDAEGESKHSINLSVKDKTITIVREGVTLTISPLPPRAPSIKTDSDGTPKLEFQFMGPQAAKITKNSKNRPGKKYTYIGSVTGTKFSYEMSDDLNLDKNLPDDDEGAEGESFDPEYVFGAMLMPVALKSLLQPNTPKGTITVSFDFKDSELIHTLEYKVPNQKASEVLLELHY